MTHSKSGRRRRPRPKATFIEEARRHQIIAAAIDTIADVGYASASFARIAARADISPSLISYHFVSRAELTRAVAESLDEHLRSAVGGAVEGTAPHLAAARAIATAFVQYVHHNRNRMLALRQLDAALGLSERSGIGVLDEDSGIAGWHDLLLAGQGVGEFRAFDARVMAASIMGILAAVPRQVFNDAGADADHLANEVATTIEHAIRVRGSRLRAALPPDNQPKETE